MTIYDEMMKGAIDVHCHIDFEFSARERKREPEFQWLPKADALGMRGVVLKSHWWPTANVVPYILASVQTNVALWSSVALNITAGGQNPCIIEVGAALRDISILFAPRVESADVKQIGINVRFKLDHTNY